jgi:uncharacterized protein YuzE
MRVTYDRSADAMYVYLRELRSEEKISFTYPCDPNEIEGMINLDFDQDKRIVGIEILGASARAPKELMDRTELQKTKEG